MRTTRKIADMQIGEQGYATPWGLGIDGNGDGWLNSNYTVEPQPGGTAQLLVIRNEDGWWAEITPGCNYFAWQVPTPTCGTWHNLKCARLIDRSEERSEATA